MKKLLLSLTIFTFLSVPAFAQAFSDVPPDHPRYIPIESLKNLGIINGYQDGTFHPDGEVNRVEALKMILTSAGIEAPEINGDTGFPDVPTDQWFAKFVVKAKQNGIVNGNGDGTFAPTRRVNKAEFIKMLLQSFNKDVSKHQNLTAGVSADTEPGQWFLPYISYAKTLGIINPTLENNLLPEKYLTRGEVAEIIYKLLVIERGGDAQKMLSIAESKLVSVLMDLGQNDITAAISDSSSAVFYTEEALKVSPNEGLVKAANKIALGFQELVLAYQAGVNGDNDVLVQHVKAAKEYAGNAYNDDPSTQPLGKKIKQQADVLLEQVNITIEE